MVVGLGDSYSPLPSARSRSSIMRSSSSSYFLRRSSNALSRSPVAWPSPASCGGLGGLGPCGLVEAGRRGSLARRLFVALLPQAFTPAPGDLRPPAAPGRVRGVVRARARASGPPPAPNLKTGAGDPTTPQLKPGPDDRAANPRATGKAGAVAGCTGGGTTGVGASGGAEAGAGCVGSGEARVGGSAGAGKGRAAPGCPSGESQMSISVGNAGGAWAGTSAAGPAPAACGTERGRGGRGTGEHQGSESQRRRSAAKGRHWFVSGWSRGMGVRRGLQRG